MWTLKEHYIETQKWHFSFALGLFSWGAWIQEEDRTFVNGLLCDLSEIYHNSHLHGLPLCFFHCVDHWLDQILGVPSSASFSFIYIPRGQMRVTKLVRSNKPPDWPGNKKCTPSGGYISKISSVSTHFFVFYKTFTPYGIWHVRTL